MGKGMENMSAFPNGVYKKTKKKENNMSKSERASEQIINWHENIVVPDIRVSWLYEAHSLILLAIVLTVILYTCFTMEGSIQLGIGLNIFLFISIGCLVFPAGPFIRPHPIFWRFIFSISL